MGFVYILIFFIICVGGGYYIATGLFDLTFGKRENNPYKPEKKPFINIDRSVHYHVHEHGERKNTYIDKNITVIDEETHNNVLKNKKNE